MDEVYRTQVSVRERKWKGKSLGRSSCVLLICLILRINIRLYIPDAFKRLDISISHMERLIKDLTNSPVIPQNYLLMRSRP